MARGDVEAYDGRPVQPMDNGISGAAKGAAVEEYPNVNSRPLRAKAGKSVTQMTYARAGIITPEMEFIAIRENEGRSKPKAKGEKRPYQTGNNFGTKIPEFITPEFVRDEIVKWEGPIKASGISVD